MNRRLAIVGLLSLAFCAIANDEYRDRDFEAIAQAELRGRLAKGEKPIYCGSLGYLNDGLAVDGWSFFFERDNQRLVSACAGACMVVRASQRSVCERLCPPPEWRNNNCPAAR